MIPAFFLNILYVILNFLINLFPTSAFPSEITDVWIYFWGLMNSVNFLFPVYDLAAVLVIWALLMKTNLFLAICKFIARASRARLG